MNNGEEEFGQGKTVSDLYQTYVTTHTKENQNIHRGMTHYAALDLMPSNKDIKILDLGCGGGNFLLLLHERGYHDLFGVDISPEQISLARKRRILTVEQSGALSYLKRNLAQFDVITANDFLEHLDKDEVLEVLPFILQALRPGGMFIAQTVNGSGLFFGRYYYGDFTHRTVFTRSSVLQICENAGFIDIQTFEITPKIHGLRSLARAVVWRAASVVIKTIIASEQGSFKNLLVTSNIIFTANRSPEGGGK